MNEVNTKQMFSAIMGFLKKENYDGIPEFLDKLLEEGKLTVSMLHDFLNNEYPKVPWKNDSCVSRYWYLCLRTPHQGNEKSCICR